MKKIFALAVLFAAISLVACGGEQKKAADAEAEAAVECCGDCQQAEAAVECCGDCQKDGECQKAEGECCGDCQKAEVAEQK